MRPAAPPDPAPNAVFLAALGRSGLMPPARAAELRGDPAGPDDLADRLVEAGELTRFQADKLLRGQWQGLALGPYRVLAPLGRGGMGVVYLARHLPGPDAPRGLLAVKILPPLRAAREPRTRARFLREMELGKLVPPHPHLARVLDAGEVSGVLFIAMEYVPGRTVRGVVAAGGPMPVGDAARVFAQTADGLAAAHAAGLIHRDLKPANVMVTPDGQAKLLDFGFALRVGEPLFQDPAVIGGPGYALGTMDYIAPEQAADAAAVGPSADQYALGGALYYAVTGTPPFPGGTAAQKMRWHRTEAPPAVRSLRPDLPPGFAVVIEKLMAKEPGDRFPSAAAAAAALRHWATDPGLPAAVLLVPDDAADADDGSGWSEDVIADPILDDEPSGWRAVPDWPTWVWAVLSAGALAAAMTAGFLVRLAVR